MREGEFDEFADGVGFSGTDDKVVRGCLLQHQPHGANIVWSVSPIATGAKIPQVELLLDTMLDVGHRTSDLASHKGLAAAWRLVVEQDAA